MSCWGDEHDAECQRKTAAGEPTVHWYGIFEFGKMWFGDVARHAFVKIEDPPPADDLTTIHVHEYGLAIPYDSWNFDYEGVPPDPEPEEYNPFAAGMQYGPGYGWPSSKHCEKCGSPIPLSMILCKKCSEEAAMVGMVPCPATHEKGVKHCVLCRQTPGYVEELK